MVACLVLVLTVAERARDPKSWTWFETLSKPVQPDSTGVDTLLRRAEPSQADLAVHVYAQESSPEPVKPTTPSETKPSGDDASPAAADDSATFPSAKAWNLGWKEVYQSLDFDQQTLLYDLVGSGFGRATLSAEDQKAARDLLALMTARWEAYSVKAFQSLASIDETDRSSWVEVLRDVNSRQKEKLAPALLALANGEKATESHITELKDFQDQLDSIALLRVADDTVMRPADHQVFFRFLLDPLPVAKADLSSITFLQLLKQSEDYRGKPVTIRGRVKEVIRQPAPKNRSGIEEIYIYWLMLEGGPTSPIRICSIKPPEGFPEIKPSDGKTRQRFQEDIVLRGYFLKRFAYQAKDGDRTAPFILATQPTWLPTKTLREETTDEAFMHDMQFMVPVTILVSFVIVALVYVVAFRRTTHPSPTGPSEATLKALEKFPVPLSVDESLKQLEQQDFTPQPPSFPKDL